MADARRHNSGNCGRHQRARPLTGEPLPPGFKVVLDAQTVRLKGGRLLLGGSPLRLVRLSPLAQRLLDSLLAGAQVGRGAAGMLARRLLDGGLLQPRPPRGPAAPGRPRCGDVTVVVPVRDRAWGLRATLAAIGECAEVIVVDDGSRDDSAAVARAAGARVLRHATSRGPAAARNTGLWAAGTDLVAVVDSDCRPEPGWLDPLLDHVADPLVAVVAPRLGGRPLRSGSVFARYESVRTPLDLGPREGAIQPGTRLAYAPSGALLLRRAVVGALGGFDESMPVGEDVDLLWRLIGAGWRVRYEPRARVGHEHRTAPLALLRRRADYGSSGAPLARRHPGAVPPVRINAESLALWAGLASGSRRLALAGSVAAALPVRRLGGLPLGPGTAARIIAGGHLAAGRGLAAGLLRTWLPVALAGALVSARARRLLATAATVPALHEWFQRRPPVDPLRWTALRLLDDAAYCAGVWYGCLRERIIEPLLPKVALPVRRGTRLGVVPGGGEREQCTAQDAPGRPGGPPGKDRDSSPTRGNRGTPPAQEDASR